ncbi:PIG-L family deacetylase [Streptomyces sp. 549]|uniref:PIG-L family deacetylase n=1 Tax=Streptomyces sp. 549 TaxID=3049076 RepID=UPI0024C402D8|nr:PIG-L family deacetylase [Streptomyces sp. 549]MDK1471960.1 PIG-L family deacetylase [Streptomyces sp. 549]
MTAPEPDAESWRTVVVSPHFDDAALSLGGLLPLLPRPAVVVTVHGGAPPPGAETSWWDRECGFSTAAEAHRVRVAEDAEACALLGARPVPLDEPDGPYRDAERGFPSLVPLLRRASADARVLLPLGTNQPDHARVRRECLRTLSGLPSGRRPAVSVYADLPYTGHLPGWGTEPGGRLEESLRASTDFGPAFRELSQTHRIGPVRLLRLDDGQWARKRAAVCCHASQLAALGQGHGCFLSREGPLHAEAVWPLL